MVNTFLQSVSWLLLGFGVHPSTLSEGDVIISIMEVSLNSAVLGEIKAAL